MLRRDLGPGVQRPEPPRAYGWPRDRPALVSSLGGERSIETGDVEFGAQQPSRGSVVQPW